MKNFNKKIDRFIKQSFPNGTRKDKTVAHLADGMVVTEDKPVVIRKTQVFWGIPCDEVSFTDFWIRFTEHSDKMPWDDFAASKGTYLPKARNFIHNGFLDAQTPYLMMLDSDIMFPPHIVDRLMKHNLPIVGGWYRDKNATDHHPTVYDFLKEDEKGIGYWKHRTHAGEGIEQVDGMGAGCWLMSREVAEKLGRDPYDMETGGEDLVLSRKLMKLGIPLYVDWSINCAHVGVGYV